MLLCSKAAKQQKRSIPDPRPSPIAHPHFPAYQWRMPSTPERTPDNPAGWATDPGALVYGLDLSRFADSDGDGFGDLAGALARLDHVASLGVTWIWLLPFYPSLRRDNGYDVDDHLAVDPRFGDLDGLRAFLARAHELGMRVLVDAVPHHTSDRHPWFLAAREDTDGRAGKFFVWSDDDSTEPGDHPMFPGEEESVWTFDERAGRYYHHQFYSFQPDINATDPDVFEELVQLLSFWLGVGVDGFRIDAALLLVQGKGRPDTDVDDDEFFDRLRARLRQLRPDVALIAEADEPPEAMAALIENDRFDAVIDFSLNNATFLALARGRAQPIVDALDRLDRSIPAESRLNFVRNADELDLSQLSDAEREEVFAAFARDDDDLIYGRGIRRGWAPMLQPAERVRMTLSLLHALPGVPLLQAGQELGTGDDLAVEGRGAARTTMQWDDSDWGGFTTAAESPLTLAAQVDGPFGFRVVNARAQEDDDGSLLTLARGLARVRRAAHAGAAGWTTVDVGDPAVLALRRDGLLTLHNLSDREATIEVEDGRSAVLADGWDGRTLAPYGFAWLKTA
jgi:maltose alpha-D-glucosyltransferase/alpha-amylase